MHNLNFFYLKTQKCATKSCDNRNFLSTFAMQSLIFVPIMEFKVGQAIHNGKASHDVLSIGFLKLPQKIASQRQYRV